MQSAAITSRKRYRSSPDCLYEVIPTIDVLNGERGASDTDLVSSYGPDFSVTLNVGRLDIYAKRRTQYLDRMLSDGDFSDVAVNLQWYAQEPLPSLPKSIQEGTVSVRLSIQSLRQGFQVIKARPEVEIRHFVDVCSAEDVEVVAAAGPFQNLCMGVMADFDIAPSRPIHVMNRLDIDLDRCVQFGGKVDLAATVHTQTKTVDVSPDMSVVGQVPEGCSLIDHNDDFASDSEGQEETQLQLCHGFVRNNDCVEIYFILLQEFTAHGRAEYSGTSVNVPKTRNWEKGPRSACATLKTSPRLLCSSSCSEHHRLENSKNPS